MRKLWAALLSATMVFSQLNTTVIYAEDNPEIAESETEEADQEAFEEEADTSADIEVAQEDAVENETVEIASSQPESNDEYEYQISNNSVTINKYLGSSASVIVPSEIDGYPVTAIGSYAFQNCSTLSSLTLPESLTTLKYGIISGTAIESITIPKNVSVTESTWSNNADWGPLTGAQSLKKIILADGMAAVPRCLCVNTAAETIVIPESVTSIGENAFAENRNLKNVNMENGMRLPKAIKTVGTYAFKNCTSLKEVNFTNNEETTAQGIYTATVSDTVFRDCTSLEKIHFSDNVTSIGNYVLQNCSALTDVYLGNNLKSIGYYAFQNCSTLSSLTLPESLTTLKYGIISGTAIESITIPKNVSVTESTWSNNADWGPLTGAQSLKKIILADGMAAVPRCLCVNTAAETIVIPESVTSIGEYAFGGYTNNCNIYFYGNAPGFSGSSFSKSVITAYYPKRNATWTDEVKQNYGATSITWLGWYPRSLASFEAEYFEEVYFAKTGQTVSLGGVVFSPTQIRNCYTVISKGGTAYYTVYPETSEPYLSNGSMVSRFDYSFLPPEKGAYKVDTKITLTNGQTDTITTKIIVGDHFTLIPLNYDHGIHQATKVDLFRVNESGLDSSDLIEFISNCRVSCTEGNSQIRFDSTIRKQGQSTPVTGVYMVVPDNKNPQNSTFTVTSPVGDTVTCTVAVGVSDADKERWKNNLQTSADAVMVALEQYYSKIRAKMELEKNNADAQESIIELASRLQRDSASSGYYVQMTLGDDEAEFAGYVGFANYLIHYITEGAELELIDLDKSLTEISVDLIEQVRKNLKEKKYKTSYDGYDVEIDVTSYSTSPDTSADFGSITVTKGFSTRAQGIVVSTPEKVTQAMNKYLSNLSDIVKDVAKQAIFQAFKAIEQKTSVSEVTDSMIKKAFKGIEEKLRTGGFGWIIDGLEIISKVKDYCEDIAGIGDDTDLIDVLAKPNDLLKKITEDTIDFESGKTSSDRGIISAVNKVDTAFSTFKSTLENYINDTGVEDVGWMGKMMKRITGACPINMILKDPEGHVLAYMNDEEEYSADGIYGEKIGDITQYYVPADMEVVVEIEAYDEGTMNYTVEELSDGEVIDRYNFYGMPLSIGSVFVNQIPANLIQSAEDVQLETEGASILPDEQINTEGAETVNVTFGDFEGGRVIGDTSYIKGDITRLSAIPDSGYRFVSWHDANDNAISMQSILRLSITKDLLLTPVFEETGRSEYEKDDIRISQESASLKPRETLQLSVTVTTASGNQSVKWASTNEEVAIVDENGLVTAMKDGTAVVYAESIENPDLRAACLVKVARVVDIYGSSLALESKVGINIYLDIEEADVKDLDIHMTMNGNETIIPAEAGTKRVISKHTYMMYEYPVTAREMRDIVTLTVVDDKGNNVKLTKDGTDYTEGYPYSASEYFARVEEVGQEKTKKLSRVLNNYGKYAQIYFDYKVTDEVKDTVSVADVTAETLESYKAVMTEETVDGLTYAGGSTMLDDAIGFRIYFKVESGYDIKKYTFTIDNKAVTPEKSGSMYFVELADIAAKDLGVMHTIKATDGTKTFGIQYSALSYARRVLELTGEDRVPLQNMCRAMYLYNQQAIEYFNTK